MDVGTWPVFNVADASIITGLVILAYIFLIVKTEDQDVSSVYNWCPVCDGEMRPVRNGWRCSTCGVRERVIGEALSGESLVEELTGEQRF
jgi:exosome complex RNA-binding protein Csl4|tara:strand:- start:105 stop:374 length:270 start_codon:yes stop_codon:yes gene_type:complete